MKCPQQAGLWDQPSSGLPSLGLLCPRSSSGSSAPAPVAVPRVRSCCESCSRFPLVWHGPAVLPQPLSRAFPQVPEQFQGVNTPQPCVEWRWWWWWISLLPCIADCVLGCIGQTIMLYYLMVFSLLAFCCRRFRCCLWASLWEEFWRKGRWPGRARRAAEERSSSWDLHKDLKQCEGCWK